MTELSVNWRKLLLIVGLLALTSSAHSSARAMGDIQVTFPKSGPHWCWLRSAAGQVTAGPVEVASTGETVVSGLPGDTVVALDTRTGKTATKALTFTPDGLPGPVQFSAADFRDPPTPALVPALAGLSALLGGLLLWQTVRGRRFAASPHPSAAPTRVEPEETEDQPAPLAARGPGLPLTTTPAAKLIGVQGLVAGGTFALTTGDVLVGRDGDNDIVLAENLVSRRHARLRRDAQGRIVLTDLGSANGVHVNGMRVARVYLVAGDEIKIGDNFFRFHVEKHTEEKPQ